MKYEEIVAKVKKAYAKADTSKVDGHLAVQVDVTGEGEGAFYIEVADGKITVAPFEYYDMISRFSVQQKRSSPLQKARRSSVKRLMQVMLTYHVMLIR